MPPPRARRAVRMMRVRVEVFRVLEMGEASVAILLKGVAGGNWRVWGLM